jgi:hypothetical protein
MGEHVAKISERLDAREPLGHPPSVAPHDRRSANALRRELNEAHWLIDALCRRFPDLHAEEWAGSA